jgi:hypothetical protein
MCRVSTCQSKGHCEERSDVAVSEQGNSFVPDFVGDSQ